MRITNPFLTIERLDARISEVSLPPIERIYQLRAHEKYHIFR